MPRNGVPQFTNPDLFSDTVGTLLATHNAAWASIGFEGASNSYPVGNFSIRTVDASGVASTNGVQLAAGARYTSNLGIYNDSISIQSYPQATPTTDDWGLCIQATSTRRGYHVRFSAFTGSVPGTVTLYEDNGTTTVQRDQNTGLIGVNFNSGHPNHTLERCPDGYIRYYAGGAVFIEWLDSTNLTGGQPGFYKENVSTAADAVFDNYISGPTFHMGQWLPYPGGMRIRRLWAHFPPAGGSNITTTTLRPEAGSMLVLSSFSANDVDNTTAVSGLDSKASWRTISGANWGSWSPSRRNSIWAAAAGNETPATITLTRTYSWRQEYSIWEVQGWDDSLPLEQAIIGAEVRGYNAPPSALYEEVYMRSDPDRHALSLVEFSQYGGRPGETFLSNYNAYLTHGSSGEQIGVSIGVFSSLAVQSYVAGPEKFMMATPGSSAQTSTSGFRVYGGLK